MNLKHVKSVKDFGSHFEIDHSAKGKFKVPKKGLSKKAQDEIAHMCNGGVLHAAGGAVVPNPDYTDFVNESRVSDPNQDLISRLLEVTQAPSDPYPPVPAPATRNPSGDLTSRGNSATPSINANYDINKVLEAAQNTKELEPVAKLLESKKRSASSQDLPLVAPPPYSADQGYQTTDADSLSQAKRMDAGFKNINRIIEQNSTQGPVNIPVGNNSDARQALSNLLGTSRTPTVSSQTIPSPLPAEGASPSSNGSTLNDQLANAFNLHLDHPLDTTLVPEPKLTKPTLSSVKSAPKTGFGTPKLESPETKIISDAVASQARASLDQADAIKSYNDAVAPIHQYQADLLANATNDWKKAKDDNDKSSTQIVSSIRDGKIDPERFWHTRTPFQTIAGSLAMLGGGLAQGFNPRLSNIANDIIGKAIDNDIDAQKADLGRKTSLLSYYVNKGNDIDNAAKLAKANILDVTAAQILQKADTLNSAEAQAKAQADAAQLQLQGSKLRQEADLVNIKKKYEPLKYQSDIALQNAHIALLRAQAGNVGKDPRTPEERRKELLGDFLSNKIANGPGSGTVDKSASDGINIPLEVYSRVDDNAREKLVQLPNGNYVQANSDKEGQQLRGLKSAVDEVKTNIDRARAYMKTGGGAELTPWTNDAGKAKALKTSIVVPLKNAYELGALSASDMGIIESLISSPDAWNQGQAAVKFNELGTTLDNMFDAALNNKSNRRALNQRLYGSK